MTIREFIDWLEVNVEDEEEIYIEDADGVLHDIKFGRKEETFDGFETVYPASITLLMKD